MMKICKKCEIEKNSNDFYKHKAVCKGCYLANVKKYEKENIDKIKIKNKKNYNSRNVEEYRKEKREYVKYRRKSDTIYALKSIISSRLRTNLKRKSKRSIEILGCAFEELKLHLESKFESWMTWENRGIYNGEFNYGWDIDHIIPLSSAKTEEEIIKLSHFTNLQPLCSKINRDIKKDKTSVAAGLF